MARIFNVPARLIFAPSAGGTWGFAKSTTRKRFLVLTFPDELETLLAEQGNAPDPHPPTLDPWKVRERFLKLKRSDNELLGFLNDTGRWDSSLGPHAIENIWGWQDAIKDMLLHQGRDWQEIISEHLNAYLALAGLAAYMDVEFRFSEGTCWVELTPYGCIGALLATVLLDRSGGARFRICRRSDCQELYQVQSRHRRKYCSQYCGHLESVRASRKPKRRK
jgi:hypothetical protein